jgi:hypothetical protein
MNNESRQDFEEWAKSNTSIGLDLDMEAHQNTEHYCDNSTYAAWEAWKESSNRKDELLKILMDIQDYRKCRGRYDFHRLPYREREYASIDAVQDLESRINKAINQSK